MLRRNRKFELPENTAPVSCLDYSLSREEKAKVKSTPGSLEEVLHALENDHEFLLKGGVFTEDLIETWFAYKRKKELEAVQLRPHPYEFALYFDT
jgi:glutamine synthetase